jgi:hypothetical protein
MKVTNTRHRLSSDQHRGQAMSPREPSLEPVCPRYGATVTETIEEVPSYDGLADPKSDAQGYAEQTVACAESDQRFAVGIRNTGACLVADLANEKIHVRVIDDPMNAPEDPWEVEAYQRENLPSDPAQIFKFATCDIGHIAAEMEGRSLVGALNRMLLVQYFSASKHISAIVSSDWCSTGREEAG